MGAWYIKMYRYLKALFSFTLYYTREFNLQITLLKSEQSGNQRNSKTHNNDNILATPIG